MSNLVKKYALVSTNYWDSGEWKSFYIITSGLTEDDIKRIKFYSDEYSRLWNDCYAQEKENAKNGIEKNLRTDLIFQLNEPINGNGLWSIKDYHELWIKKDLIIEHFDIE